MALQSLAQVPGQRVSSAAGGTGLGNNGESLVLDTLWWGGRL